MSIKKAIVVVGAEVVAATLRGIVAEDIGRCAYGIFRRGASAVGQRFGIAAANASRMPLG